MITHLEPDNLECEVKWALGPTNKGSEGDGIPAELLQILKDDAVKVLHANKFEPICFPTNLENAALATRLAKISFHSNPQKKAMSRKAQTTAQLHSSHMLVK